MFIYGKTNSQYLHEAKIQLCALSWKLIPSSTATPGNANSVSRFERMSERKGGAAVCHAWSEWTWCHPALTIWGPKLRHFPNTDWTMGRSSLALSFSRDENLAWLGLTLLESCKMLFLGNSSHECPWPQLDSWVRFSDTEKETFFAASVLRWRLHGSGWVFLVISTEC